MVASHGFVMMVLEKWWIRFRDRVDEGKSVHSYVLKGTAPPKTSRFLLFYVTNPVKQLGGSAEFVERHVGTPDELWNDYGSESVLSSRKQFEEFLGGAEKVSFVRFKNLRIATNPIPLATLRKLLGDKRLSRKGFYLDKETTDRLLAIME